MSQDMQHLIDLAMDPIHGHWHLCVLFVLRRRDGAPTRNIGAKLALRRGDVSLQRLRQGVQISEHRPLPHHDHHPAEVVTSFESAVEAMSEELDLAEVSGVAHICFLRPSTDADEDDDAGSWFQGVCAAKAPGSTETLLVGFMGQISRYHANLLLALLLTACHAQRCVAPRTNVL